MLSSHPNIELPPPETTIWRYMNLEKFISLLYTRSLFLCRLDAFRDPWEGTWPRPLIDAARANWANGQADGFLDLSQRARNFNYVSCWHASQSESAALWDLYSGKSGVAIQSTVKSLQDSISDEKDYYVGTVKYIDFDTEPVSELNLLVPPFLKRKSFEHKQEVRVLHWVAPSQSAESHSISEVENHSLTVDPSVLIEKLFISPSSPSWLAQALQELCRRFDLSTAVTKSSLYDPRVY
jgi:hypothetical protein